MKDNVKGRKAIIVSVSVVVVVIIIAVIVALICVLPKKNESGLESYVQQINTQERVEAINNPDQGFYHPIYVKLTQSGISYNKNVVTNATQLYHLRVDISSFSKQVNGAADELLTEAAISGIRELLVYLKSRGKNAIVRFAYDPSFGGSANKEPEQSVIIEHIKQVCPVLNEFETTVTAIEVGMIGPWGEMHTSQIANSAHIVPMIEAFLSDTVSIPILVRTPKMIYDYLEITIGDIDRYVIENSHKAYRLGIYNDGYLGSSSDLGTYTNREKEIAFLSNQTNHLPYGGEVVIPSSQLHNIETCLPEMFQIHLNYLNAEWNNEVINKWKNSTYTSACGDDKNYYGQSAFTYINNHMGYRYVVTRSAFEYSDKFDKLNVKLDLNNVGFGNLNKTKHAKLLFVDENGEVKLAKNVGTFDGSATVNYSTELNLEGGKYEVYLCLYGEEIEGVPKYCVQFANQDMWNSTLSANKIGEINVQA